MATRTVVHKAFVYHEDVPDPNDPNEEKLVRIERLARRGETRDFSEADTRRGDRLGALAEPNAEQSSGEESSDELDPATASLEALTSWIKEDKPTVQEVVDAADGDKVVARKLLDAENAATGNEPRKGVLDGLTHVISDTQ